MEWQQIDDRKPNVDTVVVNDVNDLNGEETTN